MPDNARNIERINAALDYMEAHLADAPPLDLVARAANCSKFHFHRIFARYTGIPVRAYMQRRRLTEAARELSRSRLPVVQVALSAGYESQQAFSGVFAAMYKIPPGRFRKEAAFYPLQLPIRFGRDFTPADACRHLEAAAAEQSDIPGWMKMMRLVVDGFPCWREDEYVASLREHIGRGEALVLRDGATVAAGLLFSSGSGFIDFFATHPFYRHSGAARRLLRRFSGMLPPGCGEIGITTFREGDRADLGQRKELVALGFTARELSVDHGYPTQKLGLVRERLQREGEEE